MRTRVFSHDLRIWHINLVNNIMINLDDNKFQGNPCKRNHIGIRYKRNGECVECSSYHSEQYHKTDKWKEYQREYMKQYRITHKEEMIEAQHRYSRRQKK